MSTEAKIDLAIWRLKHQINTPNDLLRLWKVFGHYKSELDNI